MNWMIEALEKFRDWFLSGVFWEIMDDVVPYLIITLCAFITKRVLKLSWKKLKEWWIKTPLPKKLPALALALALFVGGGFLIVSGWRLAVEYLKPVQYVDTEVSFYAGMEDVSYNPVAKLNHPEYMDADGTDVAYVWDSGEIHELWPSWEETYGLGSLRRNQSGFIQTGDDGLGDYVADAIRVRKGTLYVLTAPWREDSGEHFDYRFTLLRVGGGDRNLAEMEGAERIPSNVREVIDEPFYAGTDWLEMRFTDFLLSNDGATLWLARQDVGRGTVILERIRRVADEDEFSSADLEWFADLQFNVTDNNKPRLAMDEKGNLYISAPEDHEILRFRFENGEDSFKIFAGDEHEEGSHRDGPNPRFVNPTSIAVKGNYLYIYDSGALRRVSLDSGKCVTLAGRILEDGEGDAPVPNAKRERVSGKEAILPCGQYPGMAVFDNGTVLLCNRENGVIYRIAESHDS